MKTISISALLLILSLSAFSQKFLTQSGSIQFFSETPIENIEVFNNQVSSVINLENGAMAFSLLMKAFVFEKALMQEHFNEKYVNSDQFPKATFKGTIQNFQKLILTSAPTDVKITGELTIHGITKSVKADGSLSMSTDGSLITGLSEFQIQPEDFEIKIPSAVKENIAKYIDLKVNMKYERMD